MELGSRSITQVAKIDPTSRWVNTIKQRRGYNVATVALANKNARVL